MKKNTQIALYIVIALIIFILIGVWAQSYLSKHTTPAPATQTSTTQATTTPSRTLANTVTYSCDKGKTITAAYFNGPEAPQPAAGQPPIPTGSVDVSIGGAPTTTLAQTISADGTRYTTPDESLVFWGKGKTALVMRNNTMDLNYTNCATK